jgi:hypothetical protein
MANVGDWSEATLCESADITARFANAAKLLASGESMSAFIALTKTKIASAIDVHLREYRVEIPVEDVADLKDLIANPEVFKDAAIAHTLKLLFEKNIYEADDVHSVQSERFMREYKEMFVQGLNLMQFDKDYSTDIDDYEAAKSVPATRFRRV